MAGASGVKARANSAEDPRSRVATTTGAAKETPAARSLGLEFSAALATVATAPASPRAESRPGLPSVAAERTGAAGATEPAENPALAPIVTGKV